VIAGAPQLCTETTSIVLSSGARAAWPRNEFCSCSRYAYALCRGTRGYDPVSTCNKETPLMLLLPGSPAIMYLLQNIRSYYAICR
jgi:hypothetical protein